MYDKYFLKKVQIGTNILMTTISEAESLDVGQLDLLIAQFETNFKKVDGVMENLKGEY